MSTPGGPGIRGQYDRGPEQHHDPITGRPVTGSAPGPHGNGPGAPRQPGFGSQYQGFGVFEQDDRQSRAAEPAARRAGDRKPVVVTMAIVGVVVAGIVATVVATGGSSRNRANGGPALATPAPTSDAARLRTSGAQAAPTTGASATEDVIDPVDPVVVGWQGMGVVELGVAYDVPPGWVAKPGVVSGFENDSGEIAALRHFSGYREGFCPARDVSYRARVGTTGSGDADPVVAGRNAIRTWARLGWATDDGRQPEISMNPVRAVTLRAGNNTEAKLVSATITPPEPGPCGTPRVYIGVLALPTEGDAALLMGLADQGVPGAVPPADINKSLTSLRPLPR